MTDEVSLPRRRTPVVWTLALAWMALHALALGLSGWPLAVEPWWQFGRPDAFVLESLGALDAASVELGEIHRLVTHAFLHLFVLHVLLNAWVLIALGGLLETAVGSLRTWIVFVSSAIAGGWLEVRYGAGFGVGASGGVFGVAGALGVWAFRAEHPLAPAAGRTVLVFLILTGLLLFVPGIGHHAHYGGLAAGALAMLLLGPRRCAQPPPLGTKVAAGVLLVLVLGAGALQVRAGPAVTPPEMRSFLAEYQETEQLARRLYRRPDEAEPLERVELGQRLDALLATPWVEGWSGEEALRAYVAAWRPVAEANVPDPFAFERNLGEAEAAWAPHRRRLLRLSRFR